MRKSQIALIGCGAISREVYGPLLSRNPHFGGLVTCFDANAGALQQFCNGTKLRFGGDNYASYVGEAAVAIIATPPKTHAPIAMTCLRAGAHIILEKPLTYTTEEGADLCRVAKKKNLLVMVNNTRRMFPAYQEVRRIVADEEFGGLTSIEYSEGGVFSWPTVSGFYFDKSKGGRGVVADRGSHVLDTLSWWVGKPLQVHSCHTDGASGVEGFADIQLGWEGRNARVRLSWHNKMANVACLKFEHGTVEVGNYQYGSVDISTPKRQYQRVVDQHPGEYQDYSRSFVDKALEAVFNDGEPPICGQDVLPSLELVDACYRVAEPVKFPWLFKYDEVRQ